MDIEPLPEDAKQLSVPPFVLQPLVENVFKHGIHDIAVGGRISFSTQRYPGELHLIVRDNGAGMEPDKLAALQHAIANNEAVPEHSGLVNIHLRMQLHSGGRSRVMVDSRADEFFEARICLDLGEDKHD